MASKIAKLLAAGLLVCSTLFVSNVAFASDVEAAKAAFEALDAAEKNAQAITSAAILKACPKDFNLVEGIAETQNAVFAAFDAERGAGEAAKLIEQGAEQMGAGDGCANLSTAVKDGVYQNVFLELAK